MKKHIYSIFITLLIFANTTTQAQSWQWAKQLGNDDPYFLEYSKMISDGTNYYLLGTFGGVFYTETDTLYGNSGINDMFIIKYDANGNELWARDIGGSFTGINSQYESINGVFDSTNQCIYLSGEFTGTMFLNFSPFVELTSGGAEDIFLAKMDLDGNILWAKKMGSGYSDNAIINYRKADHKIVMAGHVDSTGYFNPYVINGGGFIAIYDTSGNCEYVKNVTPRTPYNIEGFYITFMNKDILLSGYSDATLYSIDTIPFTPKGGYDGYFARFDSIGNVKWAKQIGGSDFDAVGNIITISNSIFIMGSFGDTVIVDNDTLITNGRDILLMRLDENGNTLWKQRMNATGITNYGGILRNINNSEFALSGTFSGSANFGSLSVTSNSADKDMFIVRFDTNGICTGFNHFGTASSTDLAVNADESIVSCGLFEGSVVIGQNSFTALGVRDIYLAKHDAFTGIPNNQRVRNELYIYANPSTGSFRIRLPDEVKTLSDAVLSVHDHVGKEVGRFILGDKSDSIFDITNASSGLYIVRLTQGSKVYTGKLAVE
ncbi:MAG: hypothetical protein RIQ89_2148 [Bacteroidota bacterium]|jgi:hypothetical protein